MPWIQRDADSKHPEVLEGNNCSFFRLIHPQRFNIYISRSLGGFHIQGFVSSGGVERCHRNNETESITKGLGFGLSGRAGDLGDLILSYLSMTQFSERCILCTFWKSGSVKGSCARQQKSWICCQLCGCKKSPQQGELRVECYSQSPVCLTTCGVLYLHSRRRTILVLPSPFNSWRRCCMWTYTPFSLKSPWSESWLGFQFPRWGREPRQRSQGSVFAVTEDNSFEKSDLVL